MTDADEYPDHVRLFDLKARKGHICMGGQFDPDLGAVCGCGVVLDNVPDFMGSSPPGGYVKPNEEPPMVSGDDVPPAPFTHASGEPCYGCQSCFADVIDLNDPDADAALVAYDLATQVDTLEASGQAVQSAQDAPDMSPAVPVIDPTRPYGPAEVERAILDANRRLELGLKHEANLIAATEQAKIEYELAYARAIERSTGGAADIRKANAVIASEREYRAWHEAMAARDAIKSVTHTLRSTVSALQSVSRSVGVSYSGPQGRGQ